MKSKTGGQSPTPVNEDGKVTYLDDFFNPKAEVDRLLRIHHQGVTDDDAHR